MAIYVESGLELDLPDGAHFRFADIAAYRSRSGQHLKEMDFAWLEAGRLILLEVRSYDQLTSSLTAADFLPLKGQPAPLRFQSVVDKVTDSLLMLMAAWTGTAWGLGLKSALPAAAQARLPLKLVVAIDLPPALVVHLQGLRDSLNARLRGRLALVDMPSIALVDYQMLFSNALFGGRIARQAGQLP